MKRTINKTIYLFMGATIFLASSCKKNYINPNAATTDLVFTSAKGMMGVAVGIQRTYALNVAYGIVDANGLITNETFLLNPGNLSEAQFFAGGISVDNTNALLNNVWTTAHKCIYDANNVINAANTLADKGYASGLIGYATVIKASAMGALCMYWENVADTVGNASTVFIPRDQGYAKAIAAINKAQSAIAANAISAGFLGDLPAGMDVVNALNALKARFSLFTGNYAAAITASNAVDLTKAVTFNFDAAVPNPIFISVTSTNNVYQPIDSTLGLPIGIRPALNDARVPFYTTINPTIAPRFRLNGFWNTATRPIPVYFADEMRLIRTECLLRQSVPDPITARNILDGILKEAPGADPLGIGANIATGYIGLPDVASLLTEVYRNRCIELYLSGMKLEDMRRFGRPISERKRNFFPYPINERNNNANTPTDPVF